jgi:tRNA(Ile)-lysidine synthase
MSSAEQVAWTVRRSGLLEPGARVLALLSGGADSVCLVHVLRQLIGAGSLVCLHVNHGLRPAAADDERFCAELCESLGLDLAVERVELPERGNVEANARELRYAAAERTRASRGLDLVATGHTADDQVETVIYRLAASPGRRALLGMEPRRGRLVRPLLEVSREATRDYCRAAGLSWREDETNLDRSFARNRIRLDVLPALREVHAAADRNVLATVDELREEAALLAGAVDEAVGRVAVAGDAPAIDGARLRELDPPLRRLVLRRLAEEAARGPLPLRSSQVREIESLAERGGSASLDLGAGVTVVSEYGVLRFQRAGGDEPPRPVPLPVPGRCRFGDWMLLCELTGTRPGNLGSADEPLLDAAKLEEELTVRGWIEGDRMRPLGLGGTKSLQDLFTDQKIPRALRRTLPVVESGGEIAWVAGVAVSDRFKVTVDTTETARLRALASAGR